jgi:hypothetical protein
MAARLIVMTSALPNQKTSLSERRQALGAATAIASGLFSSFPFIFMTTRTREIPSITADGIDIPSDAFDPIGQVVVDDFDGKLLVTRHEDGLMVGDNGLELAPPHYHLELQADDDLIDDVINAINPMIEELLSTPRIKIPVAS